MEGDFVQTPAIAVEGFKARRILVCLARPFPSLHRTASFAEFRKAETVPLAAGDLHRTA